MKHTYSTNKHSIDHVFLNDFSARNIAGFGLSDGEGVECLWAYLRNFVKMTKEMCSSHRTDVLSDALRHYRWKTMEKIGMDAVLKTITDFHPENAGQLLFKRMERAVELQLEATRNLSAIKEDPLCMYVQLMDTTLTYHIHLVDVISDCDVQRWTAEVKERLSQQFGLIIFMLRILSAIL